MADEDRRCGTCRFFNEITKDERGTCQPPLPPWVRVWHWEVFAWIGTKCPCWARESDDGEGKAN